MKETKPVTDVKAMILAAGLGTRMRPLTDISPKALLEINGRTLLELAIEHLANAGVREIIINVHHFSGQIISFLEKNKNFGLSISVSDETGQLLDTGGGLKNAADFFQGDKPFIVRNADIISDMDFIKMLDYHLLNSPVATLAVRNRETSRYFIFDDSDQLVGWTNTKTGETIHASDAWPNTRNLAFSGIQILSPKIFSLMPEEKKFSLTDLYLRLARTQKIICYEDNDSKWKDIGKSVNDLNDQ